VGPNVTDSIPVNITQNFNQSIKSNSASNVEDDMITCSMREQCHEEIDVINIRKSSSKILLEGTAVRENMQVFSVLSGINLKIANT
jgi:hypothetical protein